MEAEALPGWTWVVGFALGAIVGSFLTVVIHRLPRGMSLGSPTFSFCPNCKHRLSVPDLVPLLSYLALGGRCRHCRVKVSPKYFLVELMNASIWAWVWHTHVTLQTDVGRALTYALAASALVAIVFIDWELFIIPDQLNAFLWFVGIAFNVWLYATGSPEATTWGIPSSLAGWIVGVGALWGIALFGRIAFRKDAMGHGDIKMARGIGAVLFPTAALLSFGLAVALGAVLGIVQVLLRKESDVGQGSDGASAPDGSQAGSFAQEMEPESIGSLLKSGVGYLLCLDIVGLFLPKLYERWFGEAPFEPMEEEDFVVERTMIPFGPYLALGAICAIVFREELLGLVAAYARWAFGISAHGEHVPY